MIGVSDGSNMCDVRYDVSQVRPVYLDISSGRFLPVPMTTWSSGGNPLVARSRWEGSSGTTDSFDPGDVLFIEENPHGDFSSAAWEGSTLTSGLVDLHSWLNRTFMSSPEQCFVLEGFYERCLAKVNFAADCSPIYFQCVLCVFVPLFGRLFTFSVSYTFPVRLMMRCAFFDSAVTAQREQSIPGGIRS